jgi:hypothetical protein
MRARSFRLEDNEWDLICEEARLLGVAPSRFIRDAAVSRAIWEQGRRRGEPGRTMAAIIQRLREP